MKIVFIILGGIGCVILAGLMYIGETSPETSIYLGRQIPKKYLTTIRSLELIQDDETIKYFYSDSLLDIKDGFYLVTDKSLVLYSSEWEQPAEVIPLEEITVLNADYDDSFLTDSMVMIQTVSGLEATFPLSSEKGLDKKFVAAIQEKMIIHKEPENNKTPVPSE